MNNLPAFFSTASFLRGRATPVFSRLLGVFTLATCLSLAQRAQANVYATDLRLNGSFSNINLGNNGLNITYILNEAATAGVKVEIKAGSKGRGSVVIQYSNLDQLDAILARLGR